MMVCGWLRRSSTLPAETVVADMARALRVSDSQRWAASVAGPFALAVLDFPARDGARTAPADDLTPAVSADGRYRLWFVGEAYDSDTLGAVDVRASGTPAFRRRIADAWAVRGPTALADLDGRYAIVVYDELSGSVTAANDRFGSIPIYWAANRDGAAFASGVRGVLMAPGVSAEPDRTAIVDAVTFCGTRTGGRTNVAGITMLPCASTLVLDGGESVRAYWSWPGAGEPRASRVADLVEQAHELWQSAVARRLGDAVHAGQTLSGGLDSRLILAEAAPRLPKWTAITYGVPGCDDARYAARAARAAGAEWIFHPLYTDVDRRDWLERRTALIQETDGLIDLSDLLHHEALHVLRGRTAITLSGYNGDAICGATYDAVEDAQSFVLKLPFSGSPLGMGFDQAFAWAEGLIRSRSGVAPKHVLLDTKYPQTIHRIFQAYGAHVRLRTPFTDYRLVDFFAPLPPELKARIHARWLLRKYPRWFRWIPNQRTGTPFWLPNALVQIERGRRGAVRVLAGRAYRRQRNYRAEEAHWREPHVRARIEATILRPGSISVDIFGRAAIVNVIKDLLDCGRGPAQVVGALYTYEAYHRDLATHLATARDRELAVSRPAAAGTGR